MLIITALHCSHIFQYAAKQLDITGKYSDYQNARRHFMYDENKQIKEELRK
jgi:hypothetical protein